MSFPKVRITHVNLCEGTEEEDFWEEVAKRDTETARQNFLDAAAETTALLDSDAPNDEIISSMRKTLDALKKRTASFSR
jgi:hypothetical protein